MHGMFDLDKLLGRECLNWIVRRRFWSVEEFFSDALWLYYSHEQAFINLML
jgi:hypothetical protein